MSFLRNILRNYENYAISRGRRQAHEVLMRYDDRLLSDMGIERTQLDKGVGAWPWRLVDQTATATANSGERLKMLEQQRAVNELQKYSDNELRDLGITRGTIGHAVRFGREDIDVNVSDKVA